MESRYPSFIAPSMGVSPPSHSCHRAVAATALGAMLLTAPITLPPYAISAVHAATAPTTTATAPTDGFRTVVNEAWRLVNEYYIDPTFGATNWAEVHTDLDNTPLPNELLTYAAIRRALHRLHDRYTRVLPPGEMNILQRYDVSGVGLLLTTDVSDNLVVMTDPPPDSSAALAGVRRGDVVLEVDGSSVASVSAFTVAEWMQGADGDPISIRFRDAGTQSLVRHFAPLESSPTVYRAVVVDRPSPGDPAGRLGYLRLTGFAASSRGEVAHALARLREQGATWLAVDLRGNGGGVFEGALEIAGLLEGDGVPVVDVSSRGGEAGAAHDTTKPTAVATTSGLHERYESRVVTGDGVKPWTDVDVAIVVDERSASSSEVLAGGLQHSCRAAVVGPRTYGKGLIQGVFGLPDGGGLIVTVGEYRMPSGKKIDGVGVQTDLKLRNGPVDWALRVVGVRKISEDSVSVSHEDVRSVLNACRETQA